MSAGLFIALNFSLFSPILKMFNICCIFVLSASEAALMLAMVPSFQPCLMVSLAKLSGTTCEPDNLKPTVSTESGCVNNCCFMACCFSGLILPLIVAPMLCKDSLTGTNALLVLMPA